MGFGTDSQVPRLPLVCVCLRNRSVGMGTESQALSLSVSCVARLSCQGMVLRRPIGAPSARLSSR